MRVLMTNDDGPPASDSPYILPLWKEIHQSTDWDTTVVIPSSQKSWIGKAIFVSEKVHLTRWNAAEGAAVESADKNQDEDKNLWYMLTGTPATCASIGIHHLSKTKPDLLLSGPNYGRNTSSLAALSSGTLGAALEGVGAGVRGIAVSYAIWPKSSQPEWIEAATKWTIRLARHLYENWDEGVDLYSINVPLCKELMDDDCKIYFTHVYQAQHSTLFQPTDARPLTEKELRQTAEAQKGSTRTSGSYQPRVFEFRPRFEDIAARIDSEEGRKSDTWVVANHGISVSPLKANFMHADLKGKDREIKLKL